MTPRYVSPLRYPGGKARMTGWLLDTLDVTVGPMAIEVWVEPFAGGAGAGLTLLVRDEIDSLWMCETNPALRAFWHVLATDGEHLARVVERTAVDLGVFHDARDTVAAALDGETIDTFDLAMAAFIVNRCSRSGMVLGNVGPIGGKHQAGRYTVGDRFNSAALADRLRLIAGFGERITVHDTDAVDYLAELPDSGVADECFLFVDPPYLVQGDNLYAQTMTRGDHETLAWTMRQQISPWVLTYDAEPAVGDMYPGEQILEFDIPHTTNHQVVDTEYLVASDQVPLQEGNPLGKGNVRYLGESAPAPDPWQAHSEVPKETTHV